jgi:hypothetical protein
MKNRFKPNDQIVQYRKDEIIKRGTVVKGPMRVENVDHYHVVWDWEDENGAPKKMLNAALMGLISTDPFMKDERLICDLVSDKYRYALAPVENC